jgi:hypothetical protein
MPRMLRTRNNVSIEAAITAVAKAHLRYPGVDLQRVTQLALQFDNAAAPYMTAEVTAALCVQLLRAIGARELADVRNLRAD